MSTSASGSLGTGPACRDRLCSPATYADISGRLDTLRINVARLQGFLNKATDANQIAQLEGELTQRESDLESMQGHPAHLIAEDSCISESTARRRIQEPRDLVRDELTLHADDIAEVPYETGTGPVLERSQRLFEETFAPSLSPESHRGRDR